MRPRAGLWLWRRHVGRRHRQIAAPFATSPGGTPADVIAATRFGAGPNAHPRGPGRTALPRPAVFPAQAAAHHGGHRDMVCCTQPALCFCSERGRAHVRPRARGMAPGVIVLYRVLSLLARPPCSCRVASAKAPPSARHSPKMPSTRCTADLLESWSDQNCERRNFPRYQARRHLVAGNGPSHARGKARSVGGPPSESARLGLFRPPASATSRTTQVQNGLHE